MMCKILVWPIFIFGIFSLAGISAKNISCYSCISWPTNKYCEDPMGSNVETISCFSNHVCTKIQYVTGEIAVTSRSCDLGIDGMTCQQIKKTLHDQYDDLSSFSCYTCDTDNCNSGVIWGVSLIVVLSGSIMAEIL